MSDNFEDFLVNDEENDLFYFESDHLALRGNKDYSEVLKTIVILCAQRERALKDFGKIVELRKKCIEDPLDTLEKIQSGEPLGIPTLMELPKLPVIDFSKYDVKVPENDIKMIYSDIQMNPVEEKDVILNSSNQNTNSNSKAWTHEEQKRLEELLLIYPSEPVEIKRFQKIAAALGNRSVKQVTSRVQKYFIKLYKAGLPIPGRIPKKVEKYNKKSKHQCPRNQYTKYNHYLFKPSTFFPDLYVPVTMDDQDNVPGPSVNTSLPPQTATTNYLIPTDYQQSVNLPKTENELQLELLKRVKYEKLKEEEKGEVDLFQHAGYRCDYCSMVPIIGSRWHCITCTDSIDFCTDCVVSQMYSNGSHPLNHTLVIFHNDKDDPVMPRNDADSLNDTNRDCDYSSDSSDDLESDSGTDESSTEEFKTNRGKSVIKEEKSK